MTSFSCPPPLALEGLDLYYLDGIYYQKLGEVWDHDIKDFKVLYKLLYSCGARAGSYEAHTLAISSFQRWSSKFIPISLLPSDHHFPQEITPYLVSRKAIDELTQGSSASASPSHSKETIPFSSHLLNGTVTNSIVCTARKTPADYGLPPDMKLYQSISGYGTRAHQPYHAIHFDSKWKGLILSGQKNATTRILSEEIIGGEPHLQDLVQRLERNPDLDLLVQAICDIELPPTPPLSDTTSPTSLLSSLQVDDSRLPSEVFASLHVHKVMEYSVRDLPLEVALIENFSDLPSFLACLRGYYPSLTDESRVHVFHFHLAP